MHLSNVFPSPSVLVAGTAAFSIICPSDRTVGTRQGETFAILNFDEPQILGQTVGGYTVTYNPPETTLYQIGTTAVVVTVADSVSALSCTFDVTVRGTKLRSDLVIRKTG